MAAVRIPQLRCISILHREFHLPFLLFPASTFIQDCRAKPPLKASSSCKKLQLRKCHQQDVLMKHRRCRKLHNCINTRMLDELNRKSLPHAYNRKNFNYLPFSPFPHLQDVTVVTTQRRELWVLSPWTPKPLIAAFTLLRYRRFVLLHRKTTSVLPGMEKRNLICRLFLSAVLLLVTYKGSSQFKPSSNSSTGQRRG